MGNILIDNNGNALLSNNKALEVTSAIDSNIIPENIKKDVTILGVTGTYEGSGGGSTAVIINPINGAFIGTTTTSGPVTHQYQVSSGTIVNAFLIIGLTGEFGSYDSQGQQTYEIPYNRIGQSGYYAPYSFSNCDLTVEISSSGLLTVNYNRSPSDISEYPWQLTENCLIYLILNSGQFLSDTIKFYHGYSCFVKDTLITLADRSKKKIQNIDYNDDLLVWDFDNGKLTSAKPLWITKTLVADHYHKVYLSDGTILKFVGKKGYHRLYDVDNGYFTQSVKMPGKKTIKEDGTIVEVLKWENVNEPVEYYNIITNYHINCYAEEVLTSCRYNNIYPISKDMKYIKDDRQIVPYEVFDNKINKLYYDGLRIGEQRFEIKEIIKYCSNMMNTAK